MAHPNIAGSLALGLGLNGVTAASAVPLSRGMEGYIATAWKPAPPEVGKAKWVDDKQRFIVLAASREAADAAFRAYFASHHPDRRYTPNGGRASQAYLAAAKLAPGFVTRYRGPRGRRGGGRATAGTAARGRR